MLSRTGWNILREGVAARHLRNAASFDRSTWVPGTRYRSLCKQYKMAPAVLSLAVYVGARKYGFDQFANLWLCEIACESFVTVKLYKMLLREGPKEGIDSVKGTRELQAYQLVIAGFFGCMGAGAQIIHDRPWSLPPAVVRIQDTSHIFQPDAPRGGQLLSRQVVPLALNGR